mmetsp:Transcript_1896/g.5172  ORF Transcript_1896/g.5172 Transcript_1896/m.5172 type:complete len:196 (-) Transcript_1896:80-667(-)|eukprot:CAMPEP_0179077374 /NCGR_PEP_ID=MMETSP0796-20121207/34582_1 /TAXON_ID=73915 /ORGANISM="Pyrodinium bahamense, Strain pbaha01" /LENGTH=195 /DNA_ID=CAMNT_0020774653 /DNA_START=78 /DNA_END=665 /DNA_ORIENTATION=-
MAPHYNTEDDTVKGNTGLPLFPCLPCFPIVTGATLDRRETRLVHGICDKVQDVADEQTSLMSVAVINFFTFGGVTRTKDEVTKEIKEVIRAEVPGVIHRAARRFHIGFWISLVTVVVICVVCRHSHAGVCWVCRSGFFWASWAIVPVVTYLTVRPVLRNLQAKIEVAAEAIVEDKIPSTVVSILDFDYSAYCSVM